MHPSTQYPSYITEVIDTTERRFNGEPMPPDPEPGPMVHDGVYSPVEIQRHCEAVRAEIAERQKNLIDVPV